jgi:hypothetical protein
MKIKEIFHNCSLFSVCAWTTYICVCVGRKIKLSLYWPGEALRASGGWSSQNFQKIDPWRWQGCLPYALAAFTLRRYPWYLFLVNTELPQGCIVARNIKWMNNPNDPVASQTCDLTVCSCLNQGRKTILMIFSLSNRKESWPLHVQWIVKIMFRCGL